MLSPVQRVSMYPMITTILPIAVVHSDYHFQFNTMVPVLPGPVGFGFGFGYWISLYVHPGPTPGNTRSIHSGSERDWSLPDRRQCTGNTEFSSDQSDHPRCILAYTQTFPLYTHSPCHHHSYQLVSTDPRIFDDLRRSSTIILHHNP